MLSILIPVYNINAYPLVSSLLEQLKKIKTNFEVICVDDASTAFFSENKLLDEIDSVSYIQLKKNVGRSEIRNILASYATYEYLLYLDADTLPTQFNFIEKYIAEIKKHPQNLVVAGGLAYDKSQLNKNTSLRYTYGIARESISAEIRNKTPYSSLLMSNTMVHKSVFEKVQFNNQIALYGHEDAVFSYDLFRKNIKVHHINNPVFHTGLESNHIFLNKSKIAVENLWNLYLKGMLKPEMNKLLKTVVRLKKWRVLFLFSFIFNKFNPVFERALCKENPSLFVFDFYRLSYLCAISKVKK